MLHYKRETSFKVLGGFLMFSSASSSSKSGRSKRKASKEPKSAVACAAETLAAYRAEQNIKKPPNTLKLVSLL
jgi:hypothetical protein